LYWQAVKNGVSQPQRDHSDEPMDGKSPFAGRDAWITPGAAPGQRLLIPSGWQNLSPAPDKIF
jgi:hypothetical protein